MVILFLLINASSLRYNLANTVDYWLEQDSLEEYFFDKLNTSIIYDKVEVGFFLLRDIPSDVKRAFSASSFSIGFKTDHLDLSYGRLYPCFGRGLVLREYVDEDFRVDKGFEGAYLCGRLGDISLQAISGRPKNILFTGRHYYISNDTTDVLRGVNIDYHGGLELGGRYVRLSTQEELAPYAFTELFGGNIGFNAGMLETYIEIAKKMGCDSYSAERISGTGIYTSLCFALEGLGCLVQYVNFDSLALGRGGARYNEPPAINRTGISINRGDDEMGGGLSLSFSPKDFLTLDGSFSSTTTHGKDKGVKELFFGLDYMGDAFSGQVSIDNLVQKRIEAGIKEKEEVIGEVELVLENFEFWARDNFVREDSLRYSESKMSFSYTHKSLITFTLTGEKRTIKKVGEGTRWLSLEVSANVGNSHRLVMKYGSEKGGLICSGGMCRYEEPFSGLKLSLISRI